MSEASKSREAFLAKWLVNKNQSVDSDLNLEGLLIEAFEAGRASDSAARATEPGPVSVDPVASGGEPSGAADEGRAREAFERWVLAIGEERAEKRLERRHDGCYSTWTVEMSWRAWQASGGELWKPPLGSRCGRCGGGVPATGRRDRTGECACLGGTV